MIIQRLELILILVLKTYTYWTLTQFQTSCLNTTHDLGCCVGHIIGITANKAFVFLSGGGWGMQSLQLLAHNTWYQFACRFMWMESQLIKHYVSGLQRLNYPICWRDCISHAFADQKDKMLDLISYNSNYLSPHRSDRQCTPVNSSKHAQEGKPKHRSRVLDPGDPVSGKRDQSCSIYHQSSDGFPRTQKVL